MSGESGNDLTKYSVLYDGSIPTHSGFPQIMQTAASLPVLHPFDHNSPDYTNHSTPTPYVSSYLTSVPAAHFNSVPSATYGNFHPAHHQGGPCNAHFMDRIPVNQLTSTHTSELHAIKQEEPSLIKQHPGLVHGGLPFVKQELGVPSTTQPFTSQQGEHADHRRVNGVEKEF